MTEHFRVGVITAVHGLRGEVKVFPTTDSQHRYDTLSECQNAVPRGCDRRVTLRECNINIHDYYSIYQYTCTTTINGSNCKTYSN